MRSVFFIGALALAVGALPRHAASDTLEVSSAVLNEINIVSGSTPGWLPTEDQLRQAIAITEAFLNAIDGGRYDVAHGLLEEDFKRGQTLETFTQIQTKTTERSGPSSHWKVTKITWAKSSTGTRLPGPYVAIDLIGKYENADRNCGYIVVYQPPSGGDFTVMRREILVLDNTSAREIETTRSKAELDRIWAQVSSVCPNYDPAP